MSDFSQREQIKATFYIQKLDETRSLGEWNNVPELIRKIKKHAPQRTCLILTAESEKSLALKIQQMKIQTQDINTFKSNTSSNFSYAHKHINPLIDAIEKETTYTEDRYQAQVCLGSIHWYLGQSSLAIARLPKNIKEEYLDLENSRTESPKWLKICALKASYIKAILLQKENVTTEAMSVLHSALPIVSSIPPSISHGNEARLWVEVFLTGICILSSDFLKKNPSSDLIINTISTFRHWAKFWDAYSSTPLGGRVLFVDINRRGVWREYYNTLSNFVQQRLKFPNGNLPVTNLEISVELQQCDELSQVEGQYEHLLMTEIHFPQAEDTSTEIEEFVDTAVKNWRIMRLNGFKHQDFLESKAVDNSRRILDILYRAAKKSFHSTAILRHLFIVHLSIAEFDLAFKAFDTYLVIVKKGKTRFEKTGKSFPKLESDDIFLRTVSEYIKALCRNRSYQLAEKAYKTSQFLKDWIETRHSNNLIGKNHETVTNSNSIKPEIFPQTFALAWRSIGIGFAHWARKTHDANSRSEIQSKSIECFHNALLPQYQSSNDPETMFALGLILAERRQVDAAIKVLKSGLLSTSSNISCEDSYSCGQFFKERLTIPLWHLIALLLSARQDFLSAIKACEGAFERFGRARHPLGEVVLNESESDFIDQDQNIIHEMDDFEKENLLQVKMTQLTLLEVLEGPDAAVNESHEVLILYTTLFGDPKADQTTPDHNSFQIPPKSSAGKSFRESILNCSIRKTHDNADAEQTISSDLPVIHVSADENKEKRRRSFTVTGVSQLDRPRKNSTGRSRQADNVFETFISSDKNRSQTQSGSFSFRKQNDLGQEQWLPKSNVKQHRLVSMTSVDTPTSSIQAKIISCSTSSEENFRKDVKSIECPQLQDNQNPQASYIKYNFSPSIIFPKDEQKRHKVALLVEIWLLISRFYRRASLYDDAKAAIDEARQLVILIESNMSIDSKSVLTNGFSYESGKTIAELWSDIYSELGDIASTDDSPHTAILHYETALTYFRDHRNAIVGLSDILINIHTEKLPPPYSVPDLFLPISTTNIACSPNTIKSSSIRISLQDFCKKSLNPIMGSQGYFDLATTRFDDTTNKEYSKSNNSVQTPTSLHESRHNDPSPTLLNRLAVRDRAFGLLNSLTKTEQGWNHSEAWFALARAYELSDQTEKAKEVFWWCVELEETRGVRDWTVVSSIGYLL